MIENKNDLPELPEGWVWARLENCADILDNLRVPVNAKEREIRITGKSQSELYPYYGATGQAGWIDDYLFDEELVLLGEDGAPFLDSTKNKAYIIKDKSWVNNHAHVLRAISSVTLNQFLCHYLNVFDYHGYTTGTTRLKLNKSLIRKIPVPITPIAEQHRITAKIEELFTKLDAGVESLKKAKAQLKHYRQAVLKVAMEGELTKEWRETHKYELEPASMLLERILKERHEKWEAKQLARMKANENMPKDDSWKQKYKESVGPNTEDLPELPEEWVWATLSQLGELNRGKSKHRPRNDPRLYGGPYPFVQTSDIRHSTDVLRHYSQTYSEEGLRQSRLWPKGTLCITIAANIADTAILGFDGCFPDSIVGFLAEPSHCNVHFVELFMRTAKKHLEQYAPATAQKNINLEILADVAIPLPPLYEQQKIVEEVEHRLSVAEGVEATIEANLKRSERLRQSILNQAFSGKLVPQDPNDEPANILLERIKEEKVNWELEAKEKSKVISRSKNMRNLERDTGEEKQIVGLCDILQSANKPFEPKELWLSSELDIEDFYAQLREEVVKKERIIEHRPNDTDVFLELRI